MVKSKSDQLSVQHKERGNGLMRKNEHFGALCEYNKALLYAESKENLALAYANRSAVFLEIKKYDECLLNIQWARDNDYPAEKIQKLNEREEKCKQLKAEQLFDPVDDLHDYFTLSYPPNPKVPFIADCLYLGSTKKYGRRGVFTNRDLKAGDIIAMEKHVFMGVYEDSPHIGCCNCLKANMLNLIPCTKTASLMFCSEKCRDETYEKVEDFDTIFAINRKGNQPEPYVFHPEKILRETEEAFGGRQNLIDFVEEHKLDEPFNNIDCTVFDFDFSNPDDPDYNAYLIKCLLSLGVQNNPVDVYCRRQEALPFVKEAIGGDTILEELLMKLVLICSTRNMCTGENHADEDEEYAENFSKTAGTCSLFMHMNHRCTTNIFTIQTDEGYVMIVTRPVKAGQEIFNNFYCSGGQDEKMDTKGRFMAKYVANLYCECDVCLKKIPEPPVDITEEPAYITTALKLTLPQMKFDPRHLNSYLAIIDQLKTNWETINDYYDEFGATAKVPKLISINCGLINLLNRLRFMPCAPSRKIYNNSICTIL